MTRNLVRGVDTACLSNEGVIVKKANQGRDGFQAHVVVSNVATPKDFRVVSFGATPFRTSELIEKFFIRKLPEDYFKLTNDRWHLSIRREYSNIERGHREATPSCLARGR